MAVRKVATTPAGKDIQIQQAGQSALLEICFSSGGQKPKELEGLFTDETNARLAITRYLAKRGK